MPITHLAKLPRGVSRRWLRRILAANLIGQIGIVLTGGTVRLTGSGLGCPTFPQCVPGSYIPVAHQEQGIHRFIEFGNRMLTTVLTVLAVASFLAVLRHVRAGQAGRGLLALGAVPFVGVAVQALIGGITVLTELNPAIVAVHFLVSMGLIAGSTVLLVVALTPRERLGGRPSPAVARVLVTLLCLAAAAMLALGTLVTGSGPHSGDAADPNRFDLDIQQVARLHSGAVWVFTILLIALATVLQRAGADRALRWAGGLLALTVAQGVIGYVQYALGVPVVLVALHMLGASLIVAGLTALTLAVVRRPAPREGEGPAEAGPRRPESIGVRTD